MPEIKVEYYSIAITILTLIAAILNYFIPSENSDKPDKLENTGIKSKIVGGLIIIAFFIALFSSIQTCQQSAEFNEIRDTALNRSARLINNSNNLIGSTQNVLNTANQNLEISNATLSNSKLAYSGILDLNKQANYFHIESKLKQIEFNQTIFKIACEQIKSTLVSSIMSLKVDEKTDSTVMLSTIKKYSGELLNLLKSQLSNPQLQNHKPLLPYWSGCFSYISEFEIRIWDASRPSPPIRVSLGRLQDIAYFLAYRLYFYGFMSKDYVYPIVDTIGISYSKNLNSNFVANPQIGQEHHNEDEWRRY